MLDMMIPVGQVEAVRQIIDDSANIVVLVHRNPDGDAIGSSLAMAQFLHAKGKNVQVVVPNNFPDFLAWLPNAENIIIYENSKEQAVDALNKADAVFCLDFNSLSRIADLGKVVAALSLPSVLVDHHPMPEGNFTVRISEPSACSTAELVFRLVYCLEGMAAITKEIAECIYVGMMTDTGNFAYASNRKDIYIIIAQLIAAGVDKDLLYRRVFYNYSLNRMRLIGSVLYESLRVFNKYNAALLTLNFRDMRRFSVARGDTEGLVNMPLQIKGVRFSCFLREEVPGKINVSLRSVDDFPCNEVAAEFFNGGGHRNASGGEVYGSMEYAIERFKSAIAKYKDKLTC